jgi:hypothetical protein
MWERCLLQAGYYNDVCLFFTCTLFLCRWTFFANWKHCARWQTRSYLLSVPCFMHWQSWFWLHQSSLSFQLIFSASMIQCILVLEWLCINLCIYRQRTHSILILHVWLLLLLLNAVHLFAHGGCNIFGWSIAFWYLHDIVQNRAYTIKEHTAY